MILYIKLNNNLKKIGQVGIAFTIQWVSSRSLLIIIYVFNSNLTMYTKKDSEGSRFVSLI